jgi:glutamate carboxypeptidase
MQFYPSLPTFSDDPFSASSSWLERLIRWVNICSGKNALEGRRLLLEEAGVLFQSLGAEIESFETDSQAPALIARLHPQASKKILLFGHLDTVFETNHPFQKAWIEENRLRGPGVCDMKAGVLIMYEALKHYLEKQDKTKAPSLGFTVVLNSDEEIGSAISAQLWKRLAKGHFCALGFEPSFSTKQAPRGFITERLGSCNLQVSFKGKSAHVGRNSQEGASALHGACKWWCQVEQSLKETPGLFFNLGKMEGGSGSNVVAEHARLDINARVADENTFHLFFNTLHLSAQGLDPRVSMDIEIKSQRPAKTATPSSLKLAELALETAKSLGLACSLQKTAGVCDGNNIQAEGVPTLDNLGAIGGGLHSDQEWIDLDNVEPQINLVATLFEKLTLFNAL